MFSLHHLLFLREKSPRGHVSKHEDTEAYVTLLACLIWMEGKAHQPLPIS